MADDVVRAQVAETAMGEEALREAHKFQVKGQRNHSMVDRVQRDAESAVSVVKAELGNATTSELALHTSLEGERKRAGSYGHAWLSTACESTALGGRAHTGDARVSFAPPVRGTVNPPLRRR